MCRKIFRLIIDFEIVKPYGKLLKTVKCPQFWFWLYEIIKIPNGIIEIPHACRSCEIFVKLTTN